MCSICRKLRKARKSGLTDAQSESLIEEVGSKMEESEDDAFQDHLQDLLEEILEPEE